MLDVAGTTCWNKSLALIVGWSFVTGKAGIIGDSRAKTGFADVAKVAAIAENRVRRRDGPAGVHALMPGYTGRKNPHQRHCRYPDRQPQPPASEGMKPGEILQIDPLSYGLGCPHASHG
jgi:hypothetical protein